MFSYLSSIYFKIFLCKCSMLSDILLFVLEKKTPPTATPSTQTPATVQASTQAGAPIRNFTGSLTVGEGGPIVLQDIYFLERMQHALRERIPERFVHAKGAGAHGYFEVTNDITNHCKASLFSEVGKKTKCMVRLSTVGMKYILFTSYLHYSPPVKNKMASCFVRLQTSRKIFVLNEAAVSPNTKKDAKFCLTVCRGTL
jgi:hypothetical protein